MFAYTDVVTMKLYLEEWNEGSAAGGRVGTSAHGAEASSEAAEIYAAATPAKHVIMGKKTEFGIYPSNSRLSPLTVL